MAKRVKTGFNPADIPDEPTLARHASMGVKANPSWVQGLNLRIPGRLPSTTQFRREESMVGRPEGFNMDLTRGNSLPHLATPKDVSYDFNHTESQQHHEDAAAANALLAFNPGEGGIYTPIAAQPSPIPLSSPPLSLNRFGSFGPMTAQMLTRKRSLEELSAQVLPSKVKKGIGAGDVHSSRRLVTPNVADVFANEVTKDYNDSTEEDDDESNVQRSRSKSSAARQPVRPYTHTERKAARAKWAETKKQIQERKKNDETNLKYKVRSDFAQKRKRVGGRFVPKTAEEKARDEERKRQQKIENKRLKQLKKQQKAAERAAAKQLASTAKTHKSRSRG